MDSSSLDAYVTSPFFSATLLGAVRLLYGLYALVTLVLFFVSGWKGTNEDASSFFAIFAILSYFGVTAYALVAGFHAIMYDRGHFLLARWPRPIQWMHFWLLSTIISFPIVITSIYYELFSFTPKSTIEELCYVSMHGVNAAFSIFEILLTNAPPGPWRMLLGNLVLIAGYLGIAFITRESKGFNNTFLAAYIAILLAAEVLVFTVVQGLMIGRRWAMDVLGWTNRFVYKNGFRRVDSLTTGAMGVDEFVEVYYHQDRR